MKYKKDGQTVRVPRHCKNGNHRAGRWSEYDPHAWRCLDCGKELTEKDVVDELIRFRVKILNFRRGIRRIRKEMKCLLMSGSSEI